MPAPAWSEYQQAIFAAVANSPRHLVCQAYAGSGKTTTAVEAVRHVGGGRVGMTAFARKNADELKARVGRARINTFHGFGYGATMRAFGELALDNRNDHDLCRAFNVDYLTRRAAVKLVQRCKDSLLIREPIEAADRPQLYSAMSALADEAEITILARYENARQDFFDLVLDVIDGARDPRKSGRISYDDMLWLPIVHRLSVDKFDVLFVDEAQDMNNAQLALGLMMSASHGGRVVSFGDSHQAIYGFRGAHEKAMAWLSETLEADDRDLPICYRCSRAVVRFAQQFVPEIQPAPSAEDGLVDDVGIGTLLQHAASGDFVLSRSRAGAVSTCLKLLSRDQLARIRGRDFGDDLVNFVKGSKCDRVDAFRRFVEKWKGTEVARLAEEERDPQPIIDKADCLVLLSEGMELTTELIKRLETIFQDDGPGVVCSTIHGAKGQEADVVWLLGSSFKGCHYYAEKGLKTDEDSPEYQRALRRVREENNIMYVAVTRAKKVLHCVDGTPRRLG